MLRKGRNLNILFVGDIFGKAGRRASSKLVSELCSEFKVDFCIANGENSAGGKGITRNIADKIHSYGVNVITSGNHIWARKEILDYLNETYKILRPANYPPGTPGFGYSIFGVKEGLKVGVINLQGRTYIRSIDCPFRVGLSIVEELSEKTKVIIVDFHAEATSEKIAMGWYLDGKVSAVIGTHTHIQTSDERVLPAGTAYITDTGMTGPYDSVIGVDKDRAIEGFLTQLPMRFTPARNDIRFCGAVLNVDENTGKANWIKRLQIPIQENTDDGDGE